MSRLLVVEGFQNVSVIGVSGDGGADVIASRAGKRWLFQVKRWANPVGAEVIAQTLAAIRSYEADVPVIVSKSGFTAGFMTQRRQLADEGITVQIWDRPALARRVARLDVESPAARAPGRFGLRKYQEEAVLAIVDAAVSGRTPSALVVLATGLGKTFVAAESLRRLSALNTNLRVLVVAHTNDLVYQLERSFWPFLRADQATVVVNGAERPAWTELHHFDFVFASRDSIAIALENGVDLPRYDVLVVDECHHLGADRYELILSGLAHGSADGPFLLGLTATPWRPEGGNLDDWFDGAVTSIDLVRGLQTGYLANVDYRMFTDNVDWESLKHLQGDRFTPKAINRTLFINEWDDAVVDRVREAWEELAGGGRGIIFCGTVAHAERIAERINALGFTSAKPIYSRSSSGVVMGPIERNKLLWDFAEGKVGILCSVDVLNEGVDVPDVNLVVFQRVTHSRRIFLQQLGRGLRLSPDKKRVIVLDFVSDVRRFAAGLELQRALDSHGPQAGQPVRVSLPSQVSFRRANDSDRDGESFLREWLGDLEEVEEAGDDVSVMRYPPIEIMPGGGRD